MGSEITETSVNAESNERKLPTYTSEDMLFVLTNYMETLDDATDAIAVAAADPAFLETEEYKGMLWWQDFVRKLTESVAEDVNGIADATGKNEVTS